MTAQLLKPGDEAPASGQYAIIDPNGFDTGAKSIAIMGNPFPPTPRHGQCYRLVDPTRRRSRNA